MEIKGLDDPDHGNIFASGGLAEWSTMSNQEFIENEISQGEIFNKNRLSDWINPDDYNSLSLVYRIRNDNGRVSKASIGTDISSIGIIQYSTFTNVFSGNLYADVFGRRDEEIPIYTILDSYIISLLEICCIFPPERSSPGAKNMH